MSDPSYSSISSSGYSDNSYQNRNQAESGDDEGKEGESDYCRRPSRHEDTCAPGRDYDVTTENGSSRNETFSGDDSETTLSEDDADAYPPSRFKYATSDNSSSSDAVNTTMVQFGETPRGNSEADETSVVPVELFNVTFDLMVERSLKDMEESSASARNGHLAGSVEVGALAIKKAVSGVFQNTDRAFVANFLLEYMRHKLYLGMSLVQVFNDDDKLREGLLEWNNVHLPSFDQGDFEKLFLLHVAPSLFMEGKDRRGKERTMLQAMRRSSERMFELIRESPPERDIIELPMDTISKSVLYALNGFPYDSYAAPSFLSFKDRYDLHIGYMQVIKKKKKVYPSDLEALLPEGTEEPRASKRIRLAWESRKARCAQRANNPLLLQAAANVAHELNTQAGLDINAASTTTLSALTGERPNLATDLVGDVEMLEESEDMPNNKFINKLLLSFADSYLDRRWREGEKRPVSSVSPPVEHQENKFSYVFSADNAMSEDMVKRIVEELGKNESVEFIYGAGGRTGSYMRMAFRDGGGSVPDPDEPGTSYRPFFLTGNEYHGSQKLYVGDKAVKLEIEIMNMLEQMLKPIVEEVYGKNHPFEVIMLQHVINHCHPYGDHNDNNNNTTSTGENDRYRTTRGSKLPTYAQSITATICFEERDSGEPLYSVSWKHNGDVVCTVKVGPRGIHIQLPGMNDEHMKHGVHVNPNLIPTMGWRWVISARLLIFPKLVNLEFYKAHITDQTMEKLRHPEQMHGTDPDSIVTAPLKYLSGEKTQETQPGAAKQRPRPYSTTVKNERLNLSLFKNSGNFEQCSYDYVQEHFPDLVNIPRKIKHKLKPSLLSCCYKQMRGLVRAGVIPAIERSEKTEEKDGNQVKIVTTRVNYWPLFCFEDLHGVHYPVKFRQYSEEIMRNNAKIKWKPKDKDKNPMCYSKEDKFLFLYSVFFAHQNYKQDYASLIAYLLGITTWVKMIGSGGSPGPEGENLNMPSADEPESAAHGHSSSPQPRNDMNTTLDQATLYDKVVTIFISHQVHKHLMKIVDSLSEGDLSDYHHKEYYHVVLQNQGHENLGNLQAILRERGVPEKLEKGECLCLGTFYAETNDVDQAWEKGKIKSIFGGLPKKDYPRALFRESKYRAPKYREVEPDFYESLPHLDKEGKLVHPPKPMRKWIIDDDCCEPLAIYVKDKRNFKSTLQGDDHFTANFIWKSFLKELAKDKYLLPLNPLGDEASDESGGSDDEDNSYCTLTDDDEDYGDDGGFDDDATSYCTITDEALGGKDGGNGGGGDDDAGSYCTLSIDNSSCSDNSTTQWNTLESNDTGRATRLAPWKKVMEFALKDENKDRLRNHFSTAGYTDFITLACDLSCDCEQCKLVTSGKIFIPEPRMIHKISTSRDWAFDHLIQSFVVILRHHYRDRMASRHMLLVPGARTPCGALVTSLGGIKEVKTTLYSENNGHFAALTLIIGRKIAVIQDGFMPVASQWQDEVGLFLSCLLSLSDQEVQAVEFDPTQVTHQNARSLDEYRSSEPVDSDHWRVFVGKSIDQTRNGTECGYICVHNILEDVAGDDVPILSDHKQVRDVFCKKFCELIELHANVIKFPVPIRRQRNRDMLRELGCLEHAVTIDAGKAREVNSCALPSMGEPTEQGRRVVGGDTVGGFDEQEISSYSDSDYSDLENDDLLIPAAQVYKDRKCKEGKEKDKISLSSFELVRSMMIMSAADSMRACEDCFEWIKEGNDKEMKWKATPLKPYELGTVLRMFPNPNPSRATNVNCDTLIQTILPSARPEENSDNGDDGSISISGTGKDDSRSCSDSDMQVDVIDDDMVEDSDDVIPASKVHVVSDEMFDNGDGDRSSCSEDIQTARSEENGNDDDYDSDSVLSDLPSDAYPLKQRLRLDNNMVDDGFCNTVFQCVQASLNSNPAATGMYQKEYHVPPQHVVPDPDHLDKYLEFLTESNKNGSKMSHHRHNQYTEAVPEKVRKDSTSYKTFIGNLSHNFGQKLREIVDDSTTDHGGKPDRREVLFKLAGLLAESCSGTDMVDWIFIANQTIANVNELYEGEPLGEGNWNNIPVAYGSTKGVQYLNRVRTKPGQPKKARKKRNKKVKIYFLSDFITEEEGREIFQEVNSLTDTELAVLLYYRDEHGAVRSMYNGRAFGCDDVEHWDCKVYHVAKGRSNGWQVTLKPKFTKAYCRPFKHNNEIFRCSPGLFRIFKWARACFKQLAKEKRLCTPSSLLFKEEREKLKETIQKMKEIEEDEDRYRTQYIPGWSQYNIACGLSD